MIFLMIIDSDNDIKYIYKAQIQPWLSGAGDGLVPCKLVLTHWCHTIYYLYYFVWLSYSNILYLLTYVLKTTICIAHRPVKTLDVGLLVVMIWLELCTTYGSSIPVVVTTTSIILCFNKHRLTQVHLENGC